MPMPVIVHISADFPDPLAPDNTSAICNLVDGTPGFRHIVYSLHRVSGRSGVEGLRFGEDRVAVAYGAPPWGLMLATRLRGLARWMLSDLAARRVRPDVVHAHKLTIEGLVAGPVARHYRVPLLCSVQAKTDVKVLRARPDLRGRYREIWHGAHHVFPFSPRALATSTAVLGSRSGPATLLPCITLSDAIGPAPVVQGHRIVSMFRLDDYRGKNAETLIKAVMRARHRIPDLTLDIYGSGQPQSFLRLGEMIRRQSAEQVVRLKGRLPGGRVQDTMRLYSAFAMPTLRESYGMVFAEALLAGVPILQTKGWGLHGLFVDADVGYACANPRSCEEVAHGLVDLVANEERLKSNIARLQQQGAFDLLRREHIIEAYRAALERVVGTSVGAGSPEQANGGSERAANMHMGATAAASSA